MRAVAGAGAGAARRGRRPDRPRPASPRSNPTIVSYPSDAYAAIDDDPATRRRASAAGHGHGCDEDDDGGTSPLVWVAGLGAILLLAAIAFLVFQLLSSAGRHDAADQGRRCPNFVGTLLADATQEADGLGITLEPTDVPSDQPVGTILSQDPPKDTLVDPGSTIRVSGGRRRRTGPDAGPAQQDRGAGGRGDRRWPA